MLCSETYESTEKFKISFWRILNLGDPPLNYNRRGRARSLKGYENILHQKCSEAQVGLKCGIWL
jgi:hypothetical protein